MKTENKIRKDIDSKLSMLCAETDRIRKYNLVKDVYDLILNDEDEYNLLVNIHDEYFDYHANKG